MSGSGHADGGGRSKPVEEGVDGKNEKTVRKPKEHAERDPKNKPKPVWLQVGNPKGPNLFKLLHNQKLTMLDTKYDSNDRRYLWVLDLAGQELKAKGRRGFQQTIHNEAFSNGLYHDH